MTETKFKAGDKFRVVKDSAIPEYDGRTGVVTGVYSGHVPYPIQGVLDDEGRENVWCDGEIELITPEPQWSVEDVKVGDTIRLSVEGKVTEWNGEWITIDDQEFYTPRLKAELIEAAPNPKVGDSFVPGLPVGSVIENDPHRVFLTTKGWTWESGTVVGVSTVESVWNRNDWKIAYLP